MFAITAAIAFLFGVAAVPVPSGPTSDIVGIVTCNAYYTGPLAYVTDVQVRRADQYFYYIEIGRKEELVVDPNAGTARPATFEACNSTFMGYPASTDVVYGHVVDVATSKCLQAVYVNSTDYRVQLAPCYYSDDSGQIQQYWAMSSSAPYEITFLDEVYSVSDGEYGKDMRPLSPPGADSFTLNLAPGDHGFWLGLLINSS